MLDSNTYQSGQLLLILFRVSELTLRKNGAASSLNHGLNVLLEENSAPIGVMKIEIEHLVGETSILKLTAVYDHGGAVNTGTMVFSG